MKLLRQLDDLPGSLRGGAVTIGNFDGVHRGHARIVAQLKKLALECGGPAIVFTFEPHPVRLLRPEQAPPPLTWIERKAELLSDLGVDAIIAYPTDEWLLALSPQMFFDEFLRERLGARAVVEGPNFCFGHHRSGDIERLNQLCQQHAIELRIVSPLKFEGNYVSSSRIRNAVAVGNVAEAAYLLTQPYRIRGMVTHGSARGATIGFPTANLDAVDTLLPAVGVYAGQVALDGRHWPAAVNVGPNPTFGEMARKVEVHLVGYEGTIYGRVLEVDFLTRLREVQPFENVESLKAQLNQDIKAVRRIHESGGIDAR